MYVNRQKILSNELPLSCPPHVPLVGTLVVAIHFIDVVCLSKRILFSVWYCGLANRCHAKVAISSFSWLHERIGTGLFAMWLSIHLMVYVCDSCNLLRCFKQVSKFSYRKTVGEGVFQTLKHTWTIFSAICEAKTMFIFHGKSSWIRIWMWICEYVTVSCFTSANNFR